MKRRFSNSERVAMYLGNHGVCANCGTPLPRGWHGDHQIPYSAGGPTDLLNGQPLCPKCNQVKGVGMLSTELPVWTKDLRDWQATAFEDYMAKMQTEYLIVATPGAGKTTTALRIAHEMLRSGRVQRLVIVVPTAHLKKQWAEAALAVGIDLDYGWVVATGDEGADFHGLVVTYQQFAYRDARNMHRYLVGRRPTMIILDEVHHAGTNKAWGEGILDSLATCPYKITLSGTPFRSDRNTIPFVKYADGRSVPDFPYGYPHALHDEVCRQVVFPSFGGRVEYMRGGEVISVTFDDDVDEAGQSEMLRAALSPHGEWLRSELKDAHAELQRIRTEDPAAGGLVIAMDLGHARAIANLLADIAHEEPIVALSDDPDASKNIERYAKGSQSWLVAVRMVSEGVDIPRLRVGVYATNTTSELFFRQAVGRFVRRRHGGPEEQSAAFYIPEDPRLIALALQIKQERDHIIPDDELIERQSAERVDGSPMNGPIIPTYTEAVEGRTIFDEQAFEGQRLIQAEQLLIKAGLPTTRFQKVATVKILEAAGFDGFAAPTQPIPTTLKRDRKDRQSSLQARRVGRLAHLSGQTYKEINRNLAGELGARLGLAKDVYVDEGTPEEWRKVRGQIIEEWISHWEDSHREEAGL